MSKPLPDTGLLPGLDALRERAMAADTLAMLAFSMANDLVPLLDYRQGLVLAWQGGKARVLCISGLAKPAEDSPYLVWLERAGAWLDGQLPGAEPRWLARNALQVPPDIAEGWAEWWPAGLWCVPLHDHDGRRLGVALYLMEQPPPEVLQQPLRGLWRTWAYCWAALGRRRRGLRWQPGRRQLALALLCAAAILFIPVRQSALAPAAIVSREAQIVSSPIDGVIAAIQVRPNQPVAAGTPLFTLDETTLRSRVEVLGRQVAVADAELMSASQRAFDNVQRRSEIAALTGTLQQRRAELAAVQAQLQRTKVLSPRAGVAVFRDPDDWLGKPVAAGERIMQIASPQHPAMLIHLPVADAIALEPGAEVTLYLTAHPLTPLQGKVLETSYQAGPAEDGVMSYRLLASIDGNAEHARLGLHGTAKLYGEQVRLGYYLLRRPLAALRAWSGW